MSASCFGTGALVEVKVEGKAVLNLQTSRKLKMGRVIQHKTKPYIQINQKNGLKEKDGIAEPEPDLNPICGVEDVPCSYTSTQKCCKNKVLL